MRRTALRIGAELIPLLLVFACLGLALGLIVQAHRRSLAPKVAKAPEPKPVVAAPVVSAPTPPPVIAAPPPPEPEPADPTETALAEIRSHLNEQITEAKKADAEAATLDTAKKTLKERTEGWKRRQMLAKNQLDRVDQVVSTLEQQADVLSRMRDVLAAKRDHEKVELAVAKTRSGAAILPYKGANGTWRLPIVVECQNGMATLQPSGPSFSLLQLSGIFSNRSSPIARAVALRLMQLQNIESPDGRAVVPYLLFVIRPDGIRPYYEARSRLEPLGITFGYELVDADADIEYPDLADVSEWSETPGKKKPKPDSEYVWPSERPGFAGKGPDSEFIWPTQTQTAAGGTGGDGSGTHKAGRPAFDPLAKPGIAPYSGPKTRLDSLLGDGGHPAVPADFDRGGLTPGEGSGQRQTPLKPGRVELTPEDLIAAAEEQIYGSRPGYGAGESYDPGPSTDGLGREINDPDPLAEPAPFPSGLGQNPQTAYGQSSQSGGNFPPSGRSANPSGSRYAQTAHGPSSQPNGNFPPSGGSVSPSGGRYTQTAHGPSSQPAGGLPAGSLAANPAGSGEMDRADTSLTAPQGKPATGSIGSYGQSFAPPGTSGANGVPEMPGMGEDRDSSVFDQTSQTGMATANGSGGGQGQGTKGDATPALVGMNLAGATGESKGQTGSAGGDPNNAQAQEVAGSSAGGGAKSKSKGGSGDGDPSAEAVAGDGPAKSEAYRKRRNLNLTIACGPNGLVVHPGGYRMTLPSLDADSGMLDKVLHGIVRNHEKHDPKSDWMPRLKYLIEPGGQTAYAKARKQHITGASGWPAHLQVTEGSPLRLGFEEKKTP